MRIAFLGLGHMGAELALHLVAAHELVVWNRSAAKADRLAAAGARVASSPAEAVDGADAVVTCLFGPDTVREVVLDPGLIPSGTLWLDATTVSPADAAEFEHRAAKAGVRYVATPVVGTVGPARAGKLGVYVGSTDGAARSAASSIVTPWADPARLKEVASQAEAATAKLIANLALAVSMQGLVEALRLGASQGMDAERVLDLLDSTGLAFIAHMKREKILARGFDAADFTADAIAKDLRLMLRTSIDPLPATTAALESLTRAQRSGHGAADFSVVTEPRP